MFSRIIKDPLFSFLILGALILVLYSFLNTGKTSIEDNKIIVTDEDVDRIVQLYERTWNQPPDSLALSRLINDEIKSNIYYNEGLRLNLDHNDEIIRRRLVQKYEFLIEDLIDGTDPTDEELRQFYDDNQDNYKTPKSYSFNHFYFSPDELTDAEKSAKRFYDSNLSSDPNAPKGKSNNFFIQSPLISKEVSSLWQEFGKNFGDQVNLIKKQGWHPPVRSGYGWHVLYVLGIDNPQSISFESIRTRINDDFKQKALRDYNAKVYESLKEEYTVDYRLNKWKTIERWAK